jgi:FkbM family methyltransferase
MVGTILSDFRGLRRVCGTGAAVRWIWSIGRQFPACRAARNLQPADRAMGEGPFRARLRGAKADMVGPQVLSGIREIWVRDVYLDGGFLTISPDGRVVDLGANMGNFTMLALGHGPGVTVVAVEPCRPAAEMLRRQVRQNGWEDRARVCDRFIGARTVAQDGLLGTPDFAGAEFITQEQFLDEYGLDRIDFLKCDIEGSEFGLLTEDSPLLARTKQLAIELHDWGGDRPAFLEMLRRLGFDVRVVRESGEDCVALARRR